MKKVLLIGELNKTVSNLNRYLANQFRVQLCSDSLDLVKGMIKVATPDLILVCLVGVGELDSRILDFFAGMGEKIPVLLVGTGEECKYYDRYYGDGQFDYVVRPVTQSMLLKKCGEVLGERMPESVEEDWGITFGEERRKQILVVDDSPLALRSIKSILDKMYDVDVVTSGEKAVALAKRNLPDLILLDYEMPGWDGRRVLEELRRDEETKEIQVVFLTGVADKEHIAAVLELHPEGYLLKPVEREKLLATIEQLF